MPFQLDPPPSSDPVSPFITWQRFVNDFGLNNIVLASNKDNTQQTPTTTQTIQKGQPNYYTVQNAFDYATDQIQSTLSGGVLKIPLDFTPNGGVVPDRVTQWAGVIAFCYLIGMRAPNRALPGRRGTAPAGPDYASMREQVYMEMGAHKYGQWAQMPEAVQAVDSTPVIARNFHGGNGTNCGHRNLDGQWIF